MGSGAADSWHLVRSLAVATAVCAAYYLSRTVGLAVLGTVIVMADLDRFKTINDSSGHDAGDGVIRAIADACRSAVRDTDLAGRYGGEEFAPTASFGVVDARDRNEGLQRLLRQADRALYDAKAEGRNRAVVGFTAAGTHTS